MLSVDEARAKFIQAATKLPAIETVPLAGALLRVAAQDVQSELAVPADDNSAMDGFAINVDDLGDSVAELLISQRIPAGVTPEPLLAGTAARIFTGGLLPHGANAVVIQENCEYLDEQGEPLTKVKIFKPVASGDNVRRRGQDIALGTKVVVQGQRLNAVALGLLASIGVAKIEVYKPVRVAIFSSGDELIEAGESIRPGQVYNSNRTMLIALCQQMGFKVIDGGIISDSLSATKRALGGAAKRADVIITTGGVSVGEEDHIKPALEALGAVQNWKVQMKPGKPVVLGRVVKTPLVGLPGNPVSAFVVFQLLAIPLLQSLQGQQSVNIKAYNVIADFDKPVVSREEFIRVRLSTDDQGRQQAELHSNQSSGVLSSLAWADGLVRQYVGQSISRGDTVEILPLNLGLL